MGKRFRPDIKGRRRDISYATGEEPQSSQNEFGIGFVRTYLCCVVCSVLIVASAFVVMNRWLSTLHESARGTVSAGSPGMWSNGPGGGDIGKAMAGL
eukprot:CAMPEP_0173383830 /NCGR_PEP_ID=MMETSP1356-20130122/6402_1 /TAXON_ID=77927 ORGANISM="Hemiselmis virescens, Strain PCC157" /NCGR_SAMPLE_ID=MMETSP1356 /ASSEMBLY_ACC=CAM_ASM_000847 /LENGTH=96 /DNA_ID=CAMNT_0014338871 /DNA_START=16 /DNA_END=303 /DNA_ORIENTATION=+